MIRHVAILMLVAVLGGAQAAADPALVLSPRDVGGERSATYAVGAPMELAAVYDPDGLYDAETNTVTFRTAGYYRQTVESYATTQYREGATRARSQILWIKAGATATIRAESIPPVPWIIYWTDRTRFSWEYLGGGVPPPDPHTKTKLSALDQPPPGTSQLLSFSTELTRRTEPGT